MVSLADLCRRYGVTPRALRFYEERGLIKPERDRLNWRRYDARTHADVRLIVELRRAGISVPDIRTFLELRGGPGDGDAAKEFIRSKLTARVAGLHAELASADSAARMLDVAWAQDPCRSPTPQSLASGATSLAR